MLLQLADQKYSVTLYSVTLLARMPVDFEFVAGTLCAIKCTYVNTSNLKSCRTNTSPEGYTACVQSDLMLHMLQFKHICDTVSSVCGHRNICKITMARFLDTQQPGFIKDTGTLQNIVPHGKVAVSSQKWCGLTRLSGQVCRYDLKERSLCTQKNIGWFSLLAGMRISPHQLKVSCLKLCNVLLNPVSPVYINSLAAALLNTLMLLGNPCDKKKKKKLSSLCFPPFFNDI